MHNMEPAPSNFFSGLAMWPCVNQHPSSSDLGYFDHIQKSERGLLLGGTEELWKYRVICGQLFGCMEVTWQAFVGALAPFDIDSLKSSSILGNYFIFKKFFSGKKCVLMRKARKKKWTYGFYAWLLKPAFKHIHSGLIPFGIN